MQTLSETPQKGAGAALWMSTFAFTACFAVWTIFSIIGVQIRQNLDLTETQFGLLIGAPIFTGSLIRLALGVWSEQYGGRLVYLFVMLAAAGATFLLSYAQTYPQFLLAALGVGIAGGSFAVGVTYVSKFFPPQQQGSALGVFGAGNVGAAVTKFAAPFVLIALGWEAVAQIWAAALAVIAIVFYVSTKDDPDLAARRAQGVKPRSMKEQLAPLKNAQVWRFSLYYFFVFGAFVALALWLPAYLVERLSSRHQDSGHDCGCIFRAGVSLPHLWRTSLRQGGRAPGDVLDVHRQRCSELRALLSAHDLCDRRDQRADHLPVRHRARALHNHHLCARLLYEPGQGGRLQTHSGLLPRKRRRRGRAGRHDRQGLGGLVLPIAFGLMNDLTGNWTSCFMLLFLVASGALVWMHFAIRQMEREAAGEILSKLPQFPEFKEIHEPARHAEPAGLIKDWRPEDPVFWSDKGRKIAARNLQLSVPALFLSFAVWMVWSIVVAKLPQVGFDYTTDQLFWLAALPGLSGATLRVFYSFMVPIFGGRLWTTLTTWSLLIPALGIGFAVQNPETPYWMLLLLALLCGLGGGNFASSMANIGFFFPRREKGNALALNAGLGNLGVSAMQFIVPIVITASVFGALGGPGQATESGDVLLPAERRFHSGSVHHCVGLRLLVRDERSRFGQSFLFGAICHLHAHAQLDHVLALYRDVRLVHRLLSGVSAADQHALSGRERAANRLPRSPCGRPFALADGMGFGPLRRRARDTGGIRADDRGNDRRPLLHGQQKR